MRNLCISIKIVLYLITPLFCIINETIIPWDAKCNKNNFIEKYLLFSNCIMQKNKIFHRLFIPIKKMFRLVITK